MRKAAAPPPPQSHNGNGSISAEDSDSTSGESLEGYIDLSVMLPGGKCVRMSTEKRTPMMDLLVQVTKRNGLSPGSFVLDVKSERSRDSIRYKPSTAVGSLNTGIVYVVPKSSIRDVPLRKDSKYGNQPFEKTFRLRVHLPRNQLHVLRVSQNTPLTDVFGAICVERELNSTRYELRHPEHTDEKLDPQRCLADYGLSEVAIVAVKGPSSGFSRSSSDIMALQHDDERKKHRFFGFMFKKSKSASRSIGDNSSDGHSSRGVSPARSDGSGCQSISPPPSTVGYPATNGAPNNNNKAVKKRTAPPPPKPTAPVSPLRNENDNGLTASSHSRHSSDSSGYHEASILSDSLDASGHDAEHLAETKAPTPNAKKSPAPSNLTTANSTSTLSVSSGTKKRKAPPPPPRSVSSVVLTNGQLPSVSSPTELEATFPTELEATFPTEDKKTLEESKSCNGKGMVRRDSMSSHASSTSEEVKSVTAVVATRKKAAAPVPKPRLNKSPPAPSPLPDEESRMDSRAEEENRVASKVDEENRIASKAEEVPVRSSAAAIPVNGELDSVSNTEPENGESAASPVVEAVSELYVVKLNSENNRRSSSSSTLSAHSTDSVRKLAESQGSACKKADSAPYHSNSVDSEGGSQTGPTDSGESESVPSSRRSSTISKTSSHSSTAVSEKSEKSVKMAAVVNETDAGKNCNPVVEPLLSNRLKENREISVQTCFDDEAVDSKRSSVRSGVSGKETDSGGSSRKPSSQSESDGSEDLVETETRETDEQTAAPLELFSLDEHRKSDETSEIMMEDQPESDAGCVGTVDTKTQEGSCRRASTESVKSTSKSSAGMEPEQRVTEADVIALSAQIDKTVSEHKIAAEIDEAFAAIDLMETGSDSGSDADKEEAGAEPLIGASEVDPVITWEYRIPEVPAQFQNDYDEKPEAPSSQDISATSAEVAFLPAEPLVKDAADAESLKEDPPQQQTPKEMSLLTKSSSPPANENETVERIFKRPVMSFSISTYKSRVEEESEYGHKLAKADSFCQKPPQITRTTSAFAVERLAAPKQVPRTVEPAPGHSLSIAKAIAQPTKITERADKADSDAGNVGRMRKAKSEMQLDGLAPGSAPAEQEMLQQEYLKLHNQFLQWQQQLLQNQTVLQQQQILPESATETLQRIQELHQQFMSLPAQQNAAAPVSGSGAGASQELVDYSKRTNSLPRPKSAFASAPSETVESNSLERKLPRVGPRPWVSRPVAVTLGAWQPRPNSSSGLAAPEPKVIIENKTEGKRQSMSSLHFAKQKELQQVKASQLETAAATEKHVPKPTSIRERVSSFNVANGEKPTAPAVTRKPSQTAAFLRCPVVKGFAAVEPAQQQKSKVLMNSTHRDASVANGGTSAQKQGVVRVSIGPQATRLQAVTNGADVKTASGHRGAPVVSTYTYFGDKVEARGASGKSANGNCAPVPNDYETTRTTNNNSSSNNNNSNNMNGTGKKSTTVVVNAAPSRQQSSPAPPPPPPPTSLQISQAKTAVVFNRQSSKKSVSSPESEEDVRDELMLAIRGFGGRTGLKKVSSVETGWQNRHGNL